ncbi:fungal hydrophobin [Polyporus arcularius HHB13444]|uniref:Hydrophobin n=1 Tax=Polyporus arcularius HHB13444 TaxID=1314778 RepID=A0A5C3PP06_9APHY|nr:fungal hydrophobin [Polyporus arcularius HHB13444]
MVFARALILAALPLLAVATAIQGRNDSPPPSSTDLCCDSTGTASDPAVAKELSILGIVVQDVNALIGVDCSPITVIGSSGCSATTVTCTDNSHGGLVALGCVPITL